jgi:hypothetical protein
MSAIIPSRIETVGDNAMPTELRLPVTVGRVEAAGTDVPNAAILATVGLAIVLLVAVTFPLALELPPHVSAPDAAWIVGR